MKINNLARQKWVDMVGHDLRGKIVRLGDLRLRPANRYGTLFCQVDHKMDFGHEKFFILQIDGIYFLYHHSEVKSFVRDVPSKTGSVSVLTADVQARHLIFRGLIKGYRSRSTGQKTFKQFFDGWYLDENNIPYWRDEIVFDGIDLNKGRRIVGWFNDLYI